MLVGGVTRAFGPCILAATLLLGSLSANVSAADGRRVALVIGNGAFSNLPKLTNPPKDAALMAAKLRSVGFEVDLAIDNDHLSLKERVRSFGRRARGASAALFYYAGHGIQADGSNYLLPVDAKLRRVADLRSKSLPLSLVSDELKFADAKINLIILDACRNNPLTRSLATRSVNITRGLASIQRASGTLVAYATAPGDVAYDGDGMENSPFTQAVADWIDEPDLEVAPMFQQVREQVITATGGKQVPWIEEDILGDFYFLPTSLDIAPTVAVLTPEPVAAPPKVAGEQERVQPPPPFSPEPDDEIETAWSKATALGTRDAYVEFLKNYPDSTFAKDAVGMLLQLASPLAPAAPISEPVAALPEVSEDQDVAQPPRPSSPEPDDEIETAWSKATALGTRDAYVEFLERYPNSAFAKDAVGMLLQLASPAAPQ